MLRRRPGPKLTAALSEWLRLIGRGEKLSAVLRRSK